MLWEKEPLGTAGALRLINDLDDDFLVLNGDLLTNFNYQNFFKTHISNKSMATLAVHKRTVKIDYGVVKSDKNGLLLGYTEKPVINYQVSMGINLLNRSSVKYIPEKVKFDIPDLMTKLRKSGQKVLCYPTDCYWQDIGRFDDYQKASKDFVDDPSFFLNKNTLKHP